MFQLFIVYKCNCVLVHNQLQDVGPFFLWWPCWPCLRHLHWYMICMSLTKWKARNVCASFLLGLCQIKYLLWRLASLSWGWGAAEIRFDCYRFQCIKTWEVFKTTWEIGTACELRTATSVPCPIYYIELDLRNKTSLEFRKFFSQSLGCP